MSKWAPEKQPRLAIALDPDRLALLAGSVVALIVFAVSVFIRNADLSAAALRAGIVLVVVYAATFILVLVVKRVTLTEIALRKEEERQRARQQAQESEGKSGGSE
jgi:TRAP-type mannitol/chloroaromatic compound transport system permease large subunit